MELLMNGKSLTSIRQYCEEIVGAIGGSSPQKYPSIYHFLLAEGRMFNIPNPKPKIGRRKKQACYANAARLTQERPQLRFAEGLAVSRSGTPLWHAWAVDESGNVWESTPNWSDATEYFGVEINELYLLKQCGRVGEWRSVIDNWQEGWPILKGDEGWRIVPAETTAPEIAGTSGQITSGYSDGNES